MRQTKKGTTTPLSQVILPARIQWAKTVRKWRHWKLYFFLFITLPLFIVSLIVKIVETLVRIKLRESATALSMEDAAAATGLEPDAPTDAVPGSPADAGSSSPTDAGSGPSTIAVSGSSADAGSGPSAIAGSGSPADTEPYAPAGPVSKARVQEAQTETATKPVPVPVELERVQLEKVGSP